MSIKVKYSDINNSAFNQALIKLSKETGFTNFKASYNVARILRQITSEINIARELHGNWSKEYFLKDEEGKFVPEPKSQFMFKIQPEKEQEFYTKWKDFLATEVEIKSDVIKLDDLGNVKISPEDIVALTPIMEASAS